ncbi:hypothetical protein [Oleiagrimonas sp. C23AA]|uniref:hypothetical protein n=1 Tax=Oleiagrimonas sp. C23AA TaxID=2719047 RepID=UPI00141E777F|nr:hypothetical protein [Oleiagrimonas sp. C23AA]NII11415.1 hypothetical protein [Oleiagrimonas sp. C23AA]
MNRKSLLALTASLMLAGGVAAAQNAPAPNTPPPPPAAHAMKHDMHGRMGHGHRGFDHHHGHGMRAMHGPSGAVIADLRGLERIYRMNGKNSQLIGLYNQVLSQTKDPMVRNYVYRHLARAQMRPSNTEAAAATLRKSLNENLDRLNKREAKMQAMKAKWRAQHASKQ